MDNPKLAKAKELKKMINEGVVCLNALQIAEKVIKACRPNSEWYMVQDLIAEGNEFQLELVTEYDEIMKTMPVRRWLWELI